MIVPGSSRWGRAERDAYMATLVCPAGCDELEFPVIIDGAQQLPDEVPELIHHRECPEAADYRPPRPIGSAPDPRVHSELWDGPLGDRALSERLDSND